MKGSADAPKCKFSRQMIQILNEEGMQFGTFDILQDDEVRQGLKVYSNWPTYPQLYVRGELMGGLDIVKEMRAEGGLKTELGLAIDGMYVPVSFCLNLKKRSLRLTSLKCKSSDVISEPAVTALTVAAPTLEDRLRALIKKSENVLFMKVSKRLLHYS